MTKIAYFHLSYIITHAATSHPTRGVILYTYCLDYNGFTTRSFVLQIYGDGYIPKEMDFMVVEQHPTLLNVTLHTSKVGPPVDKPRLKPWQPPWMRDFRTETISAEVGRAANASSRNWRDGLRVYSGASSWASGPRADTIAKLSVVAAAAAVAFSSASRK